MGEDEILAAADGVMVRDGAPMTLGSWGFDRSVNSLTDFEYKEFDGKTVLTGATISFDQTSTKGENSRYSVVLRTEAMAIGENHAARGHAAPCARH